jgi:moderate conductance mechanosensitive channel
VTATPTPLPVPTDVIPPVSVPPPVPTSVPPSDTLVPQAPSVGGLVSKVAEPVCANDAGSWCERFYRWTDNDFLARSADAIVGKGFAIVVIVVLALVARYLLHRAIYRLIEGATSRRVSRLISRRTRPQLGEHAAVPVSPRRAQRARTIGSVLRSGSSVVVGVVAVGMILGEFGVSLGPILASAGIVGLAVGFGAQNLVRDFLSGMFMLLEDQYGVGDIVDLGSASGTVESVGLRITTVRDGNGTVWYVRNGEILRVGNKSQGYAVAIADLPLAHNADLGQATEIATRVAAQVAEDPQVAEHLIAQPEVVGIEKVGPEGVTFRVQARTSPGQQFGVQRALITALAEAFDDEGLPRPLAFPTAPPPAAR